jgi:primosomal protein N' (replication factor Y) (superfamily II helicase)
LSEGSSYISVVFPFALPKLYTYAVPDHLKGQLKKGCRVEVELRNKVYSAIVVELFDTLSNELAAKEIVSIIDFEPIITEIQLKLWDWIAKYYCCSLGEVMEAAIPAGLKLSSESIISVGDEYNDEIDALSDQEYLVMEALTFQPELSINQLQEILNKKNIYSVIKVLISKNYLVIKELLTEKYKPKKIRMIRLAKIYSEEQNFETLLNTLKPITHSDALTVIYDLTKKSEWIAVSDLNDYKKISNPILKALEKKKLIEIDKKEISRLVNHDKQLHELPILSDLQNKAVSEINASFESKKVVLLHGVTGSGKTRIYQEMIKKSLDNGKQVLYLLPEIALTTQIIERLQLIFGNDVLLYHSKMNNSNRVEIWNEVLIGKKLILSARSGIFLPFQNLDLIIVDEEHDNSYRQEAPNPHYHARDTAVYFSKMIGCNVILGSATPSIESYYNAKIGLYNLIELNERFGNVALPKIEIVNLAYEIKTGRYKKTISKPMRDEVEKTLSRKEQIIMFYNRRGYVPMVSCNSCGWSSICKNCDVNLTYHKYQNVLSCHYCAHKVTMPTKCPKCNGTDIGESGQGTEKIEDLLVDIFPHAKIGRLDFDTARTKSSLEKIINTFSQGDIDILVGTQMVTKGFDFEKVSMVCILDADASLRFPDFRAHERTFQMLTQVAGRAGRRATQGKVMLQTFSPTHPIIKEIISGNYSKFFQQEIIERNQFKFPPFIKLIEIELKHSNAQRVNVAGAYLFKMLQEQLQSRVYGPTIPGVERVRNQYIRIIVLKLEKDFSLINKTKAWLMEIKNKADLIDELKSIRLNYKVD